VSEAEKSAEVPPVNPNPAPSPRSGFPPPVEHQFRPGNKSNGGRPAGASILSALLRDLAKDPDADGIGLKARAIASALIDVSSGRLDPASVDTKAALALLERTDGSVIKQTENTNRQVGAVIVTCVTDGEDSP
jgi:hypothetical protein